MSLKLCTLSLKWPNQTHYLIAQSETHSRVLEGLEGESPHHREAVPQYLEIEAGAANLESGNYRPSKVAATPFGSPKFTSSVKCCCQRTGLAPNDDGSWSDEYLQVSKGGNVKTLYHGQGYPERC